MPLRVGIVGYGEIGAFHARHLAGAGARVTGVVTRRFLPPDLRRYSSLAAMLPEVDAVTIAVPNHLHARLCLETVEAGIPVLVEKPLCIDASELRALEAVLEHTARPVHLGMRLRWNPALSALRDRIRGARRVRCTYRLGIERLAAGKAWTRRESESGGAFFALGVHALDLARWLARAGAQPLNELRAEATHCERGADFPLVVRMEGKVHNGAWIEAAADLRGDDPFRLELQVDAEQGACSDRSLEGLRPEDAAAPDAEYAGLMKHFVEEAVRGEPAPDEIAEMLECHRELLDARALSAARRA